MRLVLRRAWEPGGPGRRWRRRPDAVQRLLTSADPRDVEVGLDALADSHTPAFAAQVGALLSEETPAGVRASAARAIAGRAACHARAEVSRLLDDPDPAVRAASAAALVDEPGQAGREGARGVVCPGR